MRLRMWIGPALLAFLAFRSWAAGAQIVEVSGGASSAYEAQGATIVVHGQQSESSLGMGMLNGHFGIGGTSVRRIQGGTLSVGQQGLPVEFLTDVFDSGHSFFGDGIGIERAFSHHRSLTAFLGASSEEGGTPLFQATNLGKLSSFLQWKQPVTSRCKSWTMVLLTSTQAALESMQCSPSPRLQLAATAGVGAGAPYLGTSMVLKERRLDLRASFIEMGENFRRNNSGEVPTPEPVRENISGEWRPRRSLSFDWLHGNYLLPPAGSSKEDNASAFSGKSTLDEASISFHKHSTATSLTLLHSESEQPQNAEGASGSNLALSAMFSRTLRRFVWSETLLSSLGPSADRSFTLINGVACDVNSHLRVTEEANVSASGVTFSHGGTLLTPFSSISADYQLVYVADSPGNPFRQVLVGAVELHLIRTLELHASSTVGPTGVPLYTVQLNSLWARTATAVDRPAAVALGQSVLHGRVVDPAGNPVEGAALLIDTHPIYSDSNGFFLFREQHSAVHALQVLPSEFLSVGTYVVVAAPAQVRTTSEASAQLVRVVVASPSSAGVVPNAHNSRGVSRP